MNYQTINRTLKIEEVAVLTPFRDGVAAVSLEVKLPKHPAILAARLTPEEALETTKHFFISQKEVNGAAISLELLEKLNKYYYLEPNLLTKFKNSFVQRSTRKSEDEYQVWTKVEAQNSLAQFESPNFSVKNLIRCDWNCGLLYGLDQDLPMTRWYSISYCDIGNINNADHDLKKAYKILSQNSAIKHLEEIRIPSYNAYRASHALEFSVCLPQEQYQEICHHWKNVAKDPHWSVRVKESLLGAQHQQFDPLGLRAALKTKKSSCESCGHQEDDEDDGYPSF